MKRPRPPFGRHDEGSPVVLNPIGRPSKLCNTGRVITDKSPKYKGTPDKNIRIHVRCFSLDSID